MFTHTLLAFSLATLCFAATAPEPPKLRLGSSVLPSRYSIDLTIVPNQDVFQGIAEIALEFKQPANLIWLNALELKIKDAHIVAAGKTLPVTTVPGSKDITGFSFSEPLSGKALLHIAYEGKLSRNSSAGLFALKDGPEAYVYSQFEPTDARRAFPCFDEPGFKVPWQLTLHVRQSDMALSNTPVISETAGAEGMKTVKFAVTRPLPSYLVALAVGPFDAVSAGKVGKTVLRVIVPRGRGGEARFAAAAIPELLKLLEGYFGTRYPYEKLDSVVMPISNFAMENVGLITYGQSLLLAKPETDSIGRQRTCALVAAHEMAHQWFGDLVTTGWWNDIWLNEAFATWLEGKIVDEWKPEWNSKVSQVQETQGAMNLDSMIAARQIRQPITGDDDIANAFDGITYQKGAGVITMFEHWVGPETFRKGVRQYIKDHADGNATTADFEAAISAAARKNIAPAFNTFLDQPGVPVVTVDLDCSARQPKLKLAQKRSLPIGSAGAAPQNWQIPVCVRYGVKGEVFNECQVMTDPRTEMTLKHAKTCPAWILPNDQQAGYYRVNYPANLMQELLTGKDHALTTAERVGILGDMRSLINSGEMPPKTGLAILPELSGDPDRQVVEGAFEIARLAKGRMVPDELQSKGAAYLRELFGARAVALGWKPVSGETDDRRLLRQALVPQLASSGEQKELVAQAQTMANQWLVDRQGISPELLGSALRVAAEHGDQAFFDKLHAAAKNEQDPRIRQTLLSALGSFRNPEISKAALALLLTGEFDLRESLYPLLYGPGAYLETRELAFPFVKANLDALLAKLPREVGGDMAAALPGIGQAFCDADHRADLASFFQDRVKQYTGGPRNLAMTLESIDLCIAKRKVLGPEIADFLRSR